MVRDEELINPLWHLAKRKGEPTLLANEEFRKPDVVGNDCCDYAQVTAGPGDVGSTAILAWRRILMQDNGDISKHAHQPLGR